MEQKQLQQQIILYFSKLPQNAQTLFASMSWLEILKNIAQKYSLNQQQIETLSTETTLVLLGVIHPDEYEKTLLRELNLQKEKIEQITSEINNSILKNNRSEIIDTFQKNIKESETGEMDTRFKQLPKEIQDAIGEAKYQESLYKIFQESGLNIEQMSVIEEIIINVLLGNLSTEKFEQTVESKLSFSKEMTKKMVEMVNELIFKKIRNNIITTNREEMTEQEDEIMKSAGIEINRNKNTNNIPVVPKLLDSVRVPVIRTEHSLTNVTKTNTPNSTTSKIEIQKAPPIASSRIMANIKGTSSNTTKVSPSYSTGKDPYRLSPNE